MAATRWAFHEEGDMAMSIVSSPTWTDSLGHRSNQVGLLLTNFFMTAGYSAERATMEVVVRPLAFINRQINDVMGPGTTDAMATYGLFNPVIGLGGLALSRSGTVISEVDALFSAASAETRFAVINEIKVLSRSQITEGIRQGSLRIGLGQEFGLITYDKANKVAGNMVDVYYQIYRAPSKLGELGVQIHSEKLGSILLPEAPSAQMLGNAVESPIRALFAAEKNVELLPKLSAQANGADVIVKTSPP